MKKFIAGIIFAVLLLVLNPGDEKHRDKIQEQFKEEHKIAGTLGVGWVKSKTVSYHDYYLFSVTKVGDTYTSFGTLGLVFVGELDIDTGKLQN
jgi:hypothetical protein